jgi:hypothetical protein
VQFGAASWRETGNSDVTRFVAAVREAIQGSNAAMNSIIGPIL